MDDKKHRAIIEREIHVALLQQIERERLEVVEAVDNLFKIITIAGCKLIATEEDYDAIFENRCCCLQDLAHLLIGAKPRALEKLHTDVDYPMLICLEVVHFSCVLNTIRTDPELATASPRDLPSVKSLEASITRHIADAESRIRKGIERDRLFSESKPDGAVLVDLVEVAGWWAKNFYPTPEALKNRFRLLLLNKNPGRTRATAKHGENRERILGAAISALTDEVQHHRRTAATPTVTAVSLAKRLDQIWGMLHPGEHEPPLGLESVERLLSPYIKHGKKL